MQTHLREITGNEAKTGDGPLDALIEFYRAFNAADMTGLEAVWVEGEAPSMDNPIGGIRRGWGAIAEGIPGFSKVRRRCRWCSTTSPARAEKTGTSLSAAKEADARHPRRGSMSPFVRHAGSFE